MPTDKIKKEISKFSVVAYTKSGAKGSTVILPKEVFGFKPNKTLVAQAVRVYLGRQRRAHASTKTRSDVSATTAKMYRQKGTGKARHGAKSAPIFVGGGVAHGPKAIENYKLNINKKMAKKAFFSAISAKFLAGKIIVADLEKIEPKTKVLASVLGKISKDDLTLVHSGDENIIRAGRNIQNVSLIRAAELNTYEVLKARNLVLTKEALKLLEARGGKNA